MLSVVLRRPRNHDPREAHQGHCANTTVGWLNETRPVGVRQSGNDGFGRRAGFVRLSQISNAFACPLRQVVWRPAFFDHSRLVAKREHRPRTTSAMHFATLVAIAWALLVSVAAIPASSRAAPLRSTDSAATPGTPPVAPSWCLPPSPSSPVLYPEEETVEAQAMHEYIEMLEGRKAVAREHGEGRRWRRHVTELARRTRPGWRTWPPATSSHREAAHGAPLRVRPSAARARRT